MSIGSVLATQPSSTSSAPPVTSGPPPASGYLAPINPATLNQSDLPTPAAMALPANTTSLATDASNSRKFYTLTASLREIYDDNVNTSNSNPQSSFETEISPSVLVDFPTPEGDFSARYTLDLTYYSNSANGNGGNGNNGSNGESLEISHEFLAQYTHAFSERFSLNASDSFRYFTDPSLDQSVGTAYRQGNYLTYSINGSFSAQWTPLFGSTTTYANTFVKYDDSAIDMDQGNVENIGSQNFSFAVFPKGSLDGGGIVDNISYNTDQRGYTSYTIFGGVQYQFLPSISASGRAGATYTQVVDNQTSFGPYAALSLSWSFGLRSGLSLDYAHEITPSDEIGASGQTSDRFTAGFHYDITPSLSSHLSSTITESNISSGLSNGSAAVSNDQLQVYVDTGLTYRYNTYLDFDTGVSISGVSSSDGGNGSIANGTATYRRDELYLGVRGTY